MENLMACHVKTHGDRRHASRPDLISFGTLVPPTRCGDEHSPLREAAGGPPATLVPSRHYVVEVDGKLAVGIAAALPPKKQLIYIYYLVYDPQYLPDSGLSSTSKHCVVFDSSMLITCRMYISQMMNVLAL